MKIHKPTPHGTPQVISEGKLLEVIPVVTMATGDVFTLPPVVWQAPNWLVGYREDHPLGMPMTFWQPASLQIPGSNSAMGSRLTFMVRMLEHSTDPVSVATVDMEAVTALLDGIKTIRSERGEQ